MSVLFEGITTHNFVDSFTLTEFAKKHHMPVWRAVVVRLDNAHPIHFQIVIFESGTHQAPDSAQIALAVFRGECGFVPAVIELHRFAVTFADLSGRVILRRRGQRDKHSHITNAGRIAFNTGNGVHQLHTAYFRV